MSAEPVQPEQGEQQEDVEDTHSILMNAIASGQVVPFQGQKFHLAGLTKQDDPSLDRPQVFFALSGIPPYAPMQMRTWVTYLDLELARVLPEAIAAAIAEAEVSPSGITIAGEGDVASVAAAAARAEALRGGPPQ